MATVLILDDEPVIREVLGSVLAKAGHVAREAATAAEGLARLEKEPVDLLLLDLMLPGKSGAEVAWHAREAGLKTPILAVSAAMDQWDADDLRDLGITAILAKPFSNDELLEVVRRILRG